MKIKKAALWILLFSIMLSGCASSKYHISKVIPGIDIHGVLAAEFTRLFHLPEYSDTINKNRFVYVEFPGRPFDLSDLSFSSLTNILVNPEYINQAYRFARMTGSVMKRGDSAWIESTKPFENILLENDIINRDIDMIMCASYNESFFPVYPNPVIRDSVGMWNYTHRYSVMSDSILVKNELRHFAYPLYDIKMHISRINIEYGNWLTSIDDAVRDSILVVKEIILVKSLEIIIYDNTVKVNGRRLKVVESSSAHIVNDYPQIAGFIFSDPTIIVPSLH